MPSRMVGSVGTCSSCLSMILISVGESDRSFGTKVAIDAGPTSSAGIGDLLAVQDREAVDLLDDVADVDRRRRRAALDDLRRNAPADHPA